VIYLDTSALVKLYAKEENGRELVYRAVGYAEASSTSTIAYAEARAGLSRKHREGVFTGPELRQAVVDLDEDWPSFARLDVYYSVSRLAGEMAERYSLRGYDSVHLASAVLLSERFEDLRFLAFDERLNEAARGAGLVVYDDESGVKA
jgi:predicted nucleic acid-binding protein